MLCPSSENDSTSLLYSIPSVHWGTFFLSQVLPGHWGQHSPGETFGYGHVSTGHLFIRHWTLPFCKKTVSEIEWIPQRSCEMPERLLWGDFFQYIYDAAAGSTSVSRVRKLQSVCKVFPSVAAAWVEEDRETLRRQLVDLKWLIIVIKKNDLASPSQLFWQHVPWRGELQNGRGQGIWWQSILPLAHLHSSHVLTGLRKACPSTRTWFSKVQSEKYSKADAVKLCFNIDCKILRL